MGTFLIASPRRFSWIPTTYVYVLWRNKHNYGLIITKYTPYLFYCVSIFTGYNECFFWRVEVIDFLGKRWRTHNAHGWIRGYETKRCWKYHQPYHCVIPRRKKKESKRKTWFCSFEERERERDIVKERERASCTCASKHVFVDGLWQSINF